MNRMEKTRKWWRKHLCCCSVAKSCPTLCNSTDCSTPGFPVLQYLPEFVQTHVHHVGDAIQPSHPLSPLLLLPSTFPSTFSNESALGSRWPKYWSFSFSISPSSEYSGLISFRVDWFDLLAVQGQAKLKPGGSHPGLHRNGSSTSVLQTLPPPTSPLPRVPAPAGEMHAQGGRSAVNLRHLNVGLELQ